MKKRYQGSMVVEGSLVISLCLLFVMGGILLAYQVYGESTESVARVLDREMEAVKEFRMIQAGLCLLE